MPAPQYLSNTPAIAFDPPPSPSTLAEAAASCEATAAVLDILAKLTPSELGDAQIARFRSIQQQFGRFARFADLTTVLWACATLLQPQSYLEIGVRNGRSAAVVGATAPDCAIYGFDHWVREYFADPTLGPDFVRSELRAVGHRGHVELVAGESQESLPEFLSEHPDLFFDLIAIDGDKTPAVVASDYANALPRLKIGGVIVTDDLAFAPALIQVWQELVGRDSRYLKWPMTGAGAVTLAIRIGGDVPWVTAWSAGQS
ncbi:MAG: class I SAM-dependent methyltransferase [Dehalococcoidia bacterium]